MDPEVIKALASQGIFAILFGFLGHRQLKQADRLQEQNDKMTAQLFELSRQAIEASRSNMAMTERVGIILDKVSARLDP